MNSYNQFDVTGLQETESECSDNFHKTSAEPSPSNIKKYIRVDLEKGELSFTFDKRQASSLKAIHAFVMTHSDKLTSDDIDHFFEAGIHHFIKQNKYFFSPLLNKIKSCNSFILNGGVSNKKLVEEIYEKIQVKFNDEINQKMECNRFKEKINRILILQKALEENIKNERFPLPSELRANKIKIITQRLLSFQRSIRSEESQQQIATILKAIELQAEDSLILQDCKEQFKEENEDILRIINNQDLICEPLVDKNPISDKPSES